MKRLSIFAALMVAGAQVIAGPASEKAAQMRQSFEQDMQAKQQAVAAAKALANTTRQTASTVRTTAGAPLAGRGDSSGYSTGNTSIAMVKPALDNVNTFSPDTGLKAGNQLAKSVRFIVQAPGFYDRRDGVYISREENTFSYCVNRYRANEPSPGWCYSSAVRIPKSGTVRLKFNAYNYFHTYNWTNCYYIQVNERNVKGWCYYAQHNNNVSMDLRVKAGDRIRLATKIGYGKGWNSLARFTYINSAGKRTDGFGVFIQSPDEFMVVAR